MISVCGILLLILGEVQIITVTLLLTTDNGILPLAIPLFVIQFITTQVKFWCTLNHLIVTHIKMV